MPESANNSHGMPAFNTLPEENLIDFKRYFGLFLSNWYWFAFSLFIALALAYGINKYSEKVFKVSSSLLISDDQSGMDMTGLERLMPGGGIFSNQQNLKNEIGILKSFKLNKRVMDELPRFHVEIVGLGRRGIFENRYYKNAQFIVKYDSLSSQMFSGELYIEITSRETFSVEINGETIRKGLHFGERFKEAGYDFFLVKSDSTKFKYDPDDSNRFRIKFRSPESLANEYRGKLNIEPVSDEATLVTISVTGPVAFQESEYLNKLMDVYIDDGLDFKNQTAKKTIDFIDQQLKIIEDLLRKAENALQSFRLSNKLIDLSQEALEIKNSLESINQEKVTIELQKKYYEYLADYIKSKNESGELISPSLWGVTDPLLVNDVEEFARLQRQKQELKYNLSGDQPAISFIESQIINARDILAENVRNSIVSAERIISDINTRAESIENRLARLPVTERQLISIQREFDLNNTVYTYMLEKRSEASIAEASRVSTNRIIDYSLPFNAQRIEPKEKKNYLLALILGILIPGIYVFSIDKLRNKIIDKKDIEKGTDAPIIGFVGHNFNKNEIPVIKAPGSSLAESFRTIRTNLKYYLNGYNNAIISITSALSGEGKTFVSTNLSAALASLGKKTLFVGLDLRKPRIHKVLGVSSDVGLSSYLIGECTFEEAIVKTEFENLYITPSGPIPPNPSELIESEKMKEFIRKAKNEFDFILLDTPPVAIVSDGILLGQFADINLFVIRQRFSFINTLELIQNHFKKRDLKNVAIIVNDINIKGYYGYGLRYGYGFYEGYGYNYGYGHYGYYSYGKSANYYTEE